MDISKSIFKEYSKCSRYASLDDIYRNKLSSHLNCGDDMYEKITDILSMMIDEDTGDDLIDRLNEQTEALLPFYNAVEKWAINIGNKIFKSNMKFSEATLNQKCFRFKDFSGHSFYCYLDGYDELDDQIIVVEAKATTSKKFLELGPVMKKAHYPLFVRAGNIISLDHEKVVKEEFLNSYQKLFDRFSDVGKYVFDLAVERYFIENSMKKNNLNQKKIKYFIATLNSDYVFNGEYLNKEPIYDDDLIHFIDLTDITKEYLPIIDQLKNNLVNYLGSTELPEAKLENKCRLNHSDQCIFCKICFEKLFEKGSILEYLRLTNVLVEKNLKLSKFDLINQGKYMINDIDVSLLSNANHIIQRRCFDSNEEYINHNKMYELIKQINYPIYYLDFESFPSPLPRFAGEKPFSQSVFQFSVHIEKHKSKVDIDKDHISFLAHDFFDHREELIQSLIKTIDLSNGGSVVVYNKNFEFNRIKELIDYFPKYKNDLKKIMDHLIDLLDIVKTNSKEYQKLGYSEEESKVINYYHNELRGSYSIKKVLPLFSDLSYADLQVQNGNEAIINYLKFRTSPIEDLKIIKKELIEYCKLDTWSMVVILHELIKRTADRFVNSPNRG